MFSALKPTFYLSHNAILVVSSLLLALIVWSLLFWQSNRKPELTSSTQLGQFLLAIETAAIPLGDARDVGRIIEAAASADFVLLGESSHGTSEYYTMRSEISQQLIANHGYSFVAIEGDWPYIYQINRYVKGKVGAPASAREAMTASDRWPDWMWANQEFLEFVEWLHQHNQQLEPDQRVGLYGMDIQNLELSQQAMSEVDVDHPKLAQMELAHEHAQAYYDLIQAGSQENWNYRVQAMKSLVESLRGHYQMNTDQPAVKAIIWAHNTHIGDASATEMAGQGMVNIGQLLREKYDPNQIFALGFGTESGTVIAGRGWGEAREIMNIPPARADSIEYAFGQYDLPLFLLLFDDWEEGSMAQFLARRWPHRAKGVVYNPDREQFNYVGTHLPDRYDGFVFIRETSALRPL